MTNYFVCSSSKVCYNLKHCVKLLKLLGPCCKSVFNAHSVLLIFGLWTPHLCGHPTALDFLPDPFARMAACAICATWPHLVSLVRTPRYCGYFFPALRCSHYWGPTVLTLQMTSLAFLLSLFIMLIIMYLYYWIGAFVIFYLFFFKVE